MSLNITNLTISGTTVLGATVLFLQRNNHGWTILVAGTIILIIIESFRYAKFKERCSRYAYDPPM
ncbi:hypothetical protein HYV89_02725 [Candidatus Woesearchaeota archaeon]|nr:hypothetical protein [Candidatus Woesearchaeota archaeon]